nr:MAG TPA: hypothetical protein [Caudoviricetes sp.]
MFAGYNTNFCRFIPKHNIRKTPEISHSGVL